MKYYTDMDTDGRIFKFPLPTATDIESASLLRSVWDEYKLMSDFIIVNSRYIYCLDADYRSWGNDEPTKMCKSGGVHYLNARRPMIYISTKERLVMGCPAGHYFLLSPRTRRVTRDAARQAREAYRVAFYNNPEYCRAVVDKNLAYAEYDKACNTRTHTDEQHRIAKICHLHASAELQTASDAAHHVARRVYETALGLPLPTWTW